ncbi:MAG: hypothetical protein ACOYOU_18170, partial [Kiritimatiellia bacterium]
AILHKTGKMLALLLPVGCIFADVQCSNPGPLPGQYHALPSGPIRDVRTQDAVPEQRRRGNTNLNGVNCSRTPIIGFQQMTQITDIYIGNLVVILNSRNPLSAGCTTRNLSAESTRMIQGLMPTGS